MDDNKIKDTGMFLHTSAREQDCDGCGGIIRVGERHLSGIMSCCGGGCYRRMCFECLKKATAAMEVEAAG